MEYIEKIECTDTQCIWNTRVDSRSADQNRLLRTERLMELNQEAGEKILASIGLDYERLFSLGKVFLISGVNIEVMQPAAFGQELRLHTWHRGYHGVQFFRDSRISDEQGGEIARISISVCAVEPESRRILRAGDIEELGIKCAEGMPAHEWKGARLAACDGEAVGRYRVMYGDIDVNNHMNNTRYIPLLCNFVPGGMDGKYVARLQMRYMHECRCGELLTVYCHALGEGEYGFSLRGEENDERIRAVMRVESIVR